MVENNPVNALVARATLVNLGLEVVMAENGRRALEWLDAHADRGHMNRVLRRHLQQRVRRRAQHPATRET